MLYHHTDCSKSEVQEYLKRFGMHPDLIPPSSADTTAYAALLKQRKELESLRRQSGAFGIHLESICMPSPFDVISGRGKSLIGHQGNRILRNLVQEHIDSYEEADRQDKKMVSSNVVDLIKKKGRFLKEQSHGWMEIDEVAARLKVSHAFRDFRASSRKSFNNIEVKQRDMVDIFSPDGLGSFDWGSSDGEDGVNL